MANRQLDLELLVKAGMTQKEAEAVAYYSMGNECDNCHHLYILHGGEDIGFCHIEDCDCLI